MKRTGVIHIGLPKTGTTATQNSLYKWRESLLGDYGICYPAIEANHTNALCAMFAEDPRTHVAVKFAGVTTREEAEDLRRTYRLRMEDEIESSEWRTLVLSAEGLSNLSASALSQLREWIEKYVDSWVIHFWSRHPLDYTLSAIQQRLKWGSTIEGQLEDPPLPNFKGKLTNAFLAFGRDAVKLTSFEAAQKEPGGHVAAFCRNLGFEEKLALQVASDPTRRNASMSLEAALILSSLNRQRPIFVDGKMHPQRTGSDAGLILRVQGRRFDLTKARKQAIRELARPDVAWLNETFGTNYYTDVFDDVAAETAEPTDSLRADTIDSFALLVSDLANLAHHRATPRAKQTPAPMDGQGGRR